MSSFGTYLKDEILPRVVPPIVAIGLIIGLITFSDLGGFAFVQSLPLFRLDKTDAFWFSICAAIYLIPLCIVGFIAFACVTGVLGLIIKGAMLFYRHVILNLIR